MKWLCTLAPASAGVRGNSIVVDDGDSGIDPSNPPRGQLDPGTNMTLPVVSAREYNPDTDTQAQYGIQPLGDVWVAPEPQPDDSTQSE